MAESGPTKTGNFNFLNCLKGKTLKYYIISQLGETWVVGFIFHFINCTRNRLFISSKITYDLADFKSEKWCLS